MAKKSIQHGDSAWVLGHTNINQNHSYSMIFDTLLIDSLRVFFCIALINKIIMKTVSACGNKNEIKSCRQRDQHRS